MDEIVRTPFPERQDASGSHSITLRAIWLPIEIGLLAFFIFLSSNVFLAVKNVKGDSLGAGDFVLPAIGGSIALAIVSVAFFIASYRKTIAFDGDTIQCETRDMFRKQSWEEPLHAYEGLYWVEKQSIPALAMRRGPSRVPKFFIYLWHKKSKKRLLLYKTFSEAKSIRALVRASEIYSLPVMRKTKDGIEPYFKYNRPDSQNRVKTAPDYKDSQFLSTPPENVRIDRSGDAVTIDFPAKNLDAAIVPILMAVLIIPVVLGYALMHADMQVYEHALATLVFPLLAIVAVASNFGKFGFSDKLVFDSSGVSLVRKYAWNVRKELLKSAWDEILSVGVEKEETARSGYATIITHKGRMRVYAGAPESNADWLVTLFDDSLL